MRPYKNELDNRYGDFVVIDYTPQRTSYNGCVMWQVMCTKCGAVEVRNGNKLRFAKHPTCKSCGHVRK